MQHTFSANEPPPLGPLYYPFYRFEMGVIDSHEEGTTVIAKIFSVCVRQINTLQKGQSSSAHH